MRLAGSRGLSSLFETGPQVNGKKGGAEPMVKVSPLIVGRPREPGERGGAGFEGSRAGGGGPPRRDLRKPTEETLPKDKGRKNEMTELR